MVTLLMALIGPLQANSGLREVPFTAVKIKDAFWAPRIEINRKVSVPHSLDMIEKEGNVPNFVLAGQGKTTGYIGPVFADSDVYKVLESASYSLATNPDPALDKRVDEVIAKLAAAQQKDGYLNSYYEVKEPGRRLTNLRDNHELYCAGHMIEAAVAHYQATGKKNFLNIATSYADFLSKTFGTEEGKRMGYCGHPEIELALMKLYRATSQKRYFALSKFFIDNRGTHFFATEHQTPESRYDGTYWQDDVPICDHNNIKGHAVRAGYLMSGATDVAAIDGDKKLLAMIDRVWKNCTTKNMYITGGIGPSGSNEGFTKDYDLPNLSAYQETCASVSMLMWNHRLNLLYKDAKYVDVMETSLYNGVLAGVSLTGDKFFYVNPLASTGGHHRSGWFSCACCPPNVTRTLAALGNYAYATDGNDLWVNLYIQGSVKLGATEFNVKTAYPWDGAVRISLDSAVPAGFKLHLRVPGWCPRAVVSVNGRTVNALADKGYVTVDRALNKGDYVDLALDMQPRRVAANPNVVDDRGRLAIVRGPLVYCFEAADNSMPLDQSAIPAAGPMIARFEPKLLNGVVTITGDALSVPADWNGGLYSTYPTLTPFKFKAIPYYAWDNRTAGQMQVWMPTTPPMPSVGGLERKAKVSLSNPSGYTRAKGINDGVEPKSSSEQPAQLCHWWPRKGTEEWVGYEWTKPVTVSKSRVYWFDDTGRGECRLPTSWRLTYKDGATWKPVRLVDPKQGFCIDLDRWLDVEFIPVTTTAIRLEFKMQEGWSVGIHEWQVFSKED